MRKASPYLVLGRIFTFLCREAWFSTKPTLTYSNEFRPSKDLNQSENLIVASLLIQDIKMPITSLKLVNI